MAYVHAERVKERSATTGTGDYAMLGAELTYQTFVAGVGAGNSCQYAAEAVSGSDWEVGIGTVGAGGTLSRDFIIDSSNSGSAVNWAAGDKFVFNTYMTEVWDDLRVPVSSIKLIGASDPDWEQFKDDGSGSTGVYALAFASNVDQEVMFLAQLSHSYKVGTDIQPHVHWAPSTAAAGGVTWGLEYTWSNIGGTYGNTTIITADDSTDEVSHKHHIAGFDAISGTGKGISSMLICRLFRDVSDPNDTYGADAFVLEFDFHFQIDAPGSFQATSKV